MRVIPSVCQALAVAGLLLLPRAAAAQAQPDARALQEQIEQLKKEFGERIAALEAKLAAAPAAVQAATPGGRTPSSGDPGARCADRAGAGRSLEGVQSRHGGDRQLPRRRRTQHRESEPGPEMQEAEASFQAVVDPYARADFFMAFGEEGVELEEGFITLTELPGAASSRRSARCARPSARSTPSTRTRCRGPIGRSSRRTWSAAKKASAMPAFRWRG